MGDVSTTVIQPAKNVSGSLRVPGDKSISHRYAMLAAIAEGKSQLENFSTGADCASTLECLRQLGAPVQRHDTKVEIEGRGSALHAPTVALDCGNSGSTMRMLAGILAGQAFTTELVGDESLSRRPMQRIIAPLTEMGASILSDEKFHPPLRIKGGTLHGISYRMPVASAQVKSCVLFAGLLAKGETRIEEPIRTRDHGELALQAFGAGLERSGNQHSIRGKQKLHGITATIPGDISSAAFFLCAAALFPDANLIIDGVGLNPTRAAILDFLRALGLRITVMQVEEHNGEVLGTLTVQGAAKLRGGRVAGRQTADMIDELPVLAAIAPYTREGIEIRDARELRVKESDRIASMASNLRAFGAEVEILEDGLRIPGGQQLHGAELDSFGDHRIAMAGAITALRAKGATSIRNSGVVDISYPGFFSTLETLVER